MASEDYMAKFREVTSAQSIDEQTKTFLRAFVADFQGNFEVVLNLADEFRKFAPKSHVAELDEVTAHLFLEKRGETTTVKDLRDTLKLIDIDNNHRVAFIEYLLFKYQKTVKDLFTAKPNAAAIKALEAAIEKHRKVFEAKQEKEQKMTDLESKAAAGDVKAKAELRRLQMEDTSKAGGDEISALADKLKAKRALKNPGQSEEEAFKEEQAKVAEAKRQQDLDEKRKRDESRNALKAKAALWANKA